ncbi:MAG: hypothetical protein K2F99_04940, partial [Muribaculaceae bacterium]|nr:hypothetical protein [Muribaculaceae bacterium]
MKNPKYHGLFIVMCPAYAFINRSDGRFNKGMGFAREYAALLSAFWDNDYVLSQYLNDPEADSYETLQKAGITVDLEDAEEMALLHHISNQIT